MNGCEGGDRVGYEDIGRIEWFKEEYCKDCDQDCKAGSPRWLVCVLTNILYELVKSNGRV